MLVAGTRPAGNGRGGPQQLPRLVPPGSIVGGLTKDAAEATGLPPDLPAVAGAGDGQCAELGAAVDASSAYLNLGTGLTLGTHSDDYVWATRSSVLTQMLADVLEREVAISDSVETTALGAAMLAAAGVGLDGVADLAATAARMSRVAEVRTPDHRTYSRYRDAYAVHRDLYPALKTVFPRLSVLRDPRRPPTRTGET